MFAGRFDRAIVFQTPVFGKGSTGQKKATSYTTTAELMCLVEDMKGNKKFEAMQVTQEGDIAVTTRWNPLIVSTMRMFDARDGEFYVITSIQEIRREDGMMRIGKRIPQT